MPHQNRRTAQFLTFSLLLTLALLAPAVASSGQGWVLRSKHILLGVPRPLDDRFDLSAGAGSSPSPGLSVLVREGFVVCHNDRMKVPAWVSLRWTRQDLKMSEQLKVNSDRPFKPDEELPEEARAGKNYDNATSQMERGHMARQEDNWAFGQDNVIAGCLMSNIAPQHEDMNGEAWLDLEETHREVVRTGPIDRLWIISGTIFTNNEAESFVGNDVGVPGSTFKVLGWFDEDEELHVRGYVVGQSDRVRDPAHYLERVRTIEKLAGFDFFPELDPQRADDIEDRDYTNLWED